MHMGDLKIVVAGCVAQQEGAALLRRVPEVDLVMGPQYANRCLMRRSHCLYFASEIAVIGAYERHRECWERHAV